MFDLNYISNDQYLFKKHLIYFNLYNYTVLFLIILVDIYTVKACWTKRRAIKVYLFKNLSEVTRNLMLNKNLQQNYLFKSKIPMRFSNVDKLALK